MPVVGAAFAAALEHIPTATFLVSARGCILAANRVGTMWLATDRAHVTTLTRPGGPDLSRFEVTAVATGATTRFLAILRSPATNGSPGLPPGQPAVIAGLIAPLVRRIRADRRLGVTNVHVLGVEAALEQLAAAAFAVSGHGRVLAGNRLGRAWMKADGAIHCALTRLGGPDPSVFDVTPLPTGAATHHLAIRRRLDPYAEPKLAIKARLWSLTRRETEVARWILRGTTNQAIAAELGCSVKTIEHHVSSILRKSDLENRASLIVAVHDA